MSPELSADTPSLSPDGGGMGLQQVASACESVQLAISDHKVRRVADDAARAKKLLTAQLERSAASVRSAAETQVGPKHLQARVAEYRRLSETLSALEVAEQEASSVRQHEERQMRGAAEKLRLETKELKRKLQAIGTDAHVNMDQLTAEFKQETKTLKKKAKRDMQKIRNNVAAFQQVFAQQIDDDDLDDDDDSQ